MSMQNYSNNEHGASLIDKCILRQKPTSYGFVIVLLYQFLGAVVYRSLHDLVPVSEKCMNIYVLEWHIAYISRGRIPLPRVFRMLGRRSNSWSKEIPVADGQIYFLTRSFIVWEIIKLLLLTCSPGETDGETYGRYWRFLGWLFQNLPEVLLPSMSLPYLCVVCQQEVLVTYIGK